MRSVEVGEFQAQALALMAAGETLRLDRDGAPVGFFVPIAAKDRKAGREALGRLGVAVEQLLAVAGIDEDELVDELTSDRP